jgi:CheY-like chemotaxis protein
VAFVDIGLPGIDGYQVARNVRGAPDGKALFLVALTGYGGSQQRRQALDAGFDLHLVKPVDPDELARLLKELPTRTAGQGRRPDTSNAPA